MTISPSNGPYIPGDVLTCTVAQGNPAPDFEWTDNDNSNNNPLSTTQYVTLQAGSFSLKCTADLAVGGCSESLTHTGSAYSKYRQRRIVRLCSNIDDVNNMDYEIYARLTAWVKKSPCGFLTFFSFFRKRLRIFSPNFTWLLYVPTCIYAAIQHACDSGDGGVDTWDYGANWVVARNQFIIHKETANVLCNVV